MSTLNLDAKCEEIKKTLEKEGMTSLAKLQKEKGIIPAGNDLLDIMKKGADTFQSQMGRQMTYSEMREMYG